MITSSRLRRCFALTCACVMAISQAQAAENVLTLDSVSSPLKDSGEESHVPPRSTLPYEHGCQTVGLVLSGGGAKGVAHVGVIKALEDNDIPIDYVTGTSMGAIVGSLYSCGWSPEKMLSFFTAPDFLEWASGTINQKYDYYYYEPRPSSKWVDVNVDLGKKFSLSSQILPSSLISPLPMNIEFLKLYSPYTEQCRENFNRLFVPFRCVASDVYHKHKVVFGEGSLGESVRASMSFPLVFRPIELDGVLLYDGGIYDNFPVNVMEKDFNPDFMIGVSVSSADTKPIKGDVYSQLEDMIIQNNDYSLPARKGVKIQVPVLNYGVLQFDKAQTIYEIGYRTGLAMVDSIKSRLKARRPLAEVTKRREAFEAGTPKVMFDSVKVEGLKGSSARYLEYLFTGDKPGRFGMEQTVESYYRAVTDGSLSNLVPEVQFGKNYKDNVLVLKATPRRPWTLALGGYLTTSTNSMLYFSGGYHTMGHNSLDVTLGAWVGQAYFAGMLNAKFAMRSHVPSYVQFTGVMSKQKYYENEELFFKSSKPMFLSEIENYARGSYVWALGRRMKGYVSAAWGYVSDTYYPQMTGNADGSQDKMQYRLGVFSAGVEGNTLDNQMYPSEGMKWLANVDVVWQWSRYLPSGQPNSLSAWRKKPVGTLHAEWKKFYSIGRHAAIGLMADGCASIQRLDQNYANTLIHSHAFAPTPSTQNYFNLAFRSDNYVALGLVPMWKPFKRMQLRGDFYAYAPMREVKDNGPHAAASWGRWGPHKMQFIGEVAAIYNFPFASVSIYGNYLSSPARNWNFGISFGLLFKAPRLLH